MLPLKILIQRTTSSGIITPLQSGRYSCGCGSTIKRSGVRKHFDTKKHRSWVAVGARVDDVVPIVDVQSRECTICYETRTDFWSCDTCNNDHCSTCHERVDRCPFCRATIVRQPRQVTVETEQRFRTLMNEFQQRPDNIRRVAHMFIICEFVTDNLTHFPQITRNLRQTIMDNWIMHGFPVNAAIEYVSMWE